MILHGDCLERMKEIPDGSVDMVLADPPYGTTACKWDSIIPFEPMWAELKRVTKDNGAILIFGSEPFSSTLRMSNIRHYRYDWIWDKGVAGCFVQAKRMPMKTHEIVSVFSFGKTNPTYLPQMVPVDKPRTFRKAGNHAKTKTGAIPIRGDASVIAERTYSETYPKSVQRFSPRADKTRGFHPTQKPLLFLEYLIKTYTLEGETVLDFCMGSGSTGVAALNLKRKFIGIEREAEYVEIAKKRMEAVA